SGYDGFGWGFAGISAWFGSPDEPGWIYVNDRRVEDYFRGLDEGRHPVERGYRYTREDLRMFTLFQMLQGLSVDRVLYRDLFGVDPLDEHPAIWPALRDRGWFEIEADRLTVVGDGGCRWPMSQALLAGGRLEERRRAGRGRRGVPEAEAAEVAGSRPHGR